MAQFWQSAGDLTDTYAARKHAYIEVFHLASGQSTKFKAFITAMSDSFSLNYNSENVYGRNDPIVTFAGTTRSISIAWDIPSSNITDANFNMSELSKLTQFCYPAYAINSEYGLPSAGSIAKPPLVRLKFMNLISGASVGGRISPDAAGSGLLGAITGVTITPNVDMGFWEVPMAATFGLLPKVVSVSLDFTPQHEHFLGFNSLDGKPLDAKFNAFPYNFEGITGASTAKFSTQRIRTNQAPVSQAGLEADAKAAGFKFIQKETIFSPMQYTGNKKSIQNPYYAEEQRDPNVVAKQRLPLRDDKWLYGISDKGFRVIGYDGAIGSEAVARYSAANKNASAADLARLSKRLDAAANGRITADARKGSYAYKRIQAVRDATMESIKK